MVNDRGWWTFTGWIMSTQLFSAFYLVDALWWSLTCGTNTFILCAHLHSFISMASYPDFLVPNFPIFLLLGTLTKNIWHSSIYVSLYISYLGLTFFHTKWKTNCTAQIPDYWEGFLLLLSFRVTPKTHPLARMTYAWTMFSLLGFFPSSIKWT